MKKFLFAIAMVLLASCAGNKPEEGIVPEFAKGYFLHNDVSADALPAKITDQEELLAYFGRAAVMGENGQPTVIDFDQDFVVPVVYPVTDLETSIVVDSFKQTAPGELTLAVRAVRGEEPRSFTIRPMVLLIVDNQYRDFDIKVEKSE